MRDVPATTFSTHAPLRCCGAFISENTDSYPPKLSLWLCIEWYSEPKRWINGGLSYQLQIFWVPSVAGCFVVGTNFDCAAAGGHLSRMVFTPGRHNTVIDEEKLPHSTKEVFCKSPQCIFSWSVKMMK